MASRASSSRSMPYSDKMATTICLTWKESQVNKTTTVSKLRTIGGNVLYKIADILKVILRFMYSLVDVSLPQTCQIKLVLNQGNSGAILFYDNKNIFKPITYW